MKDRKDHLIEVITVRLNSCSTTHTFQEIVKDVMDSATQSTDFESIKLYKSEMVDNDWAIYLHSPMIEKDGKSSLATHLTESLRSVGLVHHKLWRSYDDASIGGLLENIKQ